MRSGSSYLGNVWLRHAQVAEAAHSGSAVKHAVVKVEVQHLRAIFYLSLGYFDSGVVLPVHDQLLELN